MKKLNDLLLDPAKRIVVAGIGNLLRNDDGVGPFIANQVRGTSNHIVIIPEAGIERYISAINREEADVIIFIDCVDFGKHPGYWDMVLAETIVESTCHSHNISLKMLTRFFNSEVWVIGVQPENIQVGETLSEPVRKASAEIIALLNQTPAVS